MKEFKINNNILGDNKPIYYIADIAANHDGDLNRAKKLIEIAKDSGANAVKFQHHNVNHYVNDHGFKSLGKKFSHQKNWKKTIYEVYKDAEVSTKWTTELKELSDKLKIDFFSTPYDLAMVDHLDKYVPAYKTGSGDLNWDKMLIKVASKNKPMFVATGACTEQEVDHAYEVLIKQNVPFCIMQCNTNYTGSLENFKYINLNVIKEYKKKYTNCLLGLSDHTPDSETVLGAIPLGIHSVEKHFTDDNDRDGPDHPFSMNPTSWKSMIVSSRRLEDSLGDGLKKVEENERETVILQRRSIRAKRNIKKGEEIRLNDFEFQRPCPFDALKLNDIDKFIGKKIKIDLPKDEYLKYDHF